MIIHDNNPNQGFFWRVGGVKWREGMGTVHGEVWAGNSE